jgi:lysophospholipase L1-like esterase
MPMNSYSKLIGILLFSASSATLAAPRLAPLATPPSNLKELPVSVGGRVVKAGEGSEKTIRYQWPGVYFEAAFTGTAAYVKVGPGNVILHLSVDGTALPPLVKPASGYYVVDGLADGAHALRIDVATESQAAPNEFGGMFVSQDAATRPVPKRARAVEFIGDSHTVGYGNISVSKECTTDQVWATTDSTQAFGPVVASHYGADYRINAISGRGVVRNYDGFKADFLPQAYPYALFDKSVKTSDSTWQPEVVVIALGTNDFSTPLKPSEQWKTRDALHADYERTYVDFVRSLRQRYPQTYFILWATDLSNGEIQTEVRKVVDELKSSGEKKIQFLPIGGLAMSGCHSHPSAGDDAAIAQRLIDAIDATPGIWPAM